MNIIFLSERDLSILDYAFATDDYEIVLDSLVPQKSTFKINKKSIKASIGDYLVVKDKGYPYLGIINSIDEEANQTLKVQTKDFLSKFDVSVPVSSFAGNMSSFLVNLIAAHFKTSGDTYQNLSYLILEIESSVSGSVTYESDQKAKIQDLVEEFSKTYGIRLAYELVIREGKFSNILVKVVSAKIGVKLRSDMGTISELKISDINENSVNKVIFNPKSDNTTYRSIVTYYLTKTGTVTTTKNTETRITPVNFKAEFYGDNDYSSLSTKATSILIDSSLEHNITFDFAYSINKVDSLNNLAIGTFVEFITPKKTYSTIVTKITYKGTFNKAQLQLGEYRVSLTDKLKLLQRKEK